MNQEETDIFFMREALRLAREAAEADEVPVGAVIVYEGRIIGAARNRRETDKLATHHAEIVAIEEACRFHGGWRLPECTLYVTLEPCPMCAGAILAARVGRVVFGAKDATAGAMGSVLNLPRFPLGSEPEVVEGVLAAESRALLQSFFKNRRK